MARKQGHAAVVVGFDIDRVGLGEVIAGGGQMPHLHLEERHAQQEDGQRRTR